jgi:hypothetical protein
MTDLLGLGLVRIVLLAARHFGHYCAAAVALTESYRSIGIYAEPNEPLPSGMLSLIACMRENEWISEAGASEQDICWDRLLFSISRPPALHPLEPHSGADRISSVLLN